MDSLGFYPNEKHWKVFGFNQILFIFLEEEVKISFTLEMIKQYDMDSSLEGKLGYRQEAKECSVSPRQADSWSRDYGGEKRSNCHST